MCWTHYIHGALQELVDINWWPGARHLNQIRRDKSRTHAQHLLEITPVLQLDTKKVSEDTARFFSNLEEPISISTRFSVKRLLPDGDEIVAS